MTHILLLLTLLIAFGFAHADSSPDKDGVATSIEASATIDNQINCASPAGSSSADELGGRFQKNTVKSTRKVKPAETHA